MRKIISVVLVIVLMLSVITGCSDKKNESHNLSTYDSEGCEALLDEITYYQRGSAGSSLKAVIVAVEILNWTERNQADRKMLSVTVDDYLDKLSKDDRVDFKINFKIIDEYADDIIDKEQYVIDLIPDAGAKLDFTSYSEEKYDVFSDSIKMKLGIDLD